MAKEPYDYVVTDRNGIVENKHRVHAAVTDSHGKLIFAIGDPSRVTLARSAAKPAQAVAILETGAFQKFGFDDADLALMCASHSSEDRHVSRATAMLARVSSPEDDLHCGGHTALSESVNRAWIKRDYSPTAVNNCCSGKHVGMLAGAFAIGADKLNYHLPEHPMQTRVKQVVQELSSVESSLISWGVDGCNLPAPAFPLRYMGYLYAKIASAADQAENGDEAIPQRTKNMARVFNAMARYPELVGGEARFCTILMETFGGALVGKLGADGCYGVGIRASPETAKLGATDALGIAVKIEDGSIEILYTVVAEILEQLQIGTPEQRARLDSFHYLERRNTMNRVIGRIYLDFVVRPT